MSIEEQDKERLLNEVRVLNQRKSDLETQIRKLEKLSQEAKGKLDMYTSEISKASDLARKNRSEAAGVLTEVATAKKNLENQKRDLDLQSKSIEVQKADLEIKISQDLEILTQTASNKVNAKEAIAKANAVFAEAQAIRESALALKDSLNAGIEESRKLEASLIEKQQSFEKERQLILEQIEISKQQVANDTLLIADKKAELTRAIDSAKKAHAFSVSKEEALNLKIMEMDKLQADLNRGILANKKEAESIATDRKQVEIDQLRVNKLARDKQVDKELAELRANKPA